MAQVANTYETYDVGAAGGNREELADKIYQITPEETPFLSLIGRKPVASVHPEWLIDSLAALDLNNNQPEGNDWAYDAVVAPARVGNYTQISDKKIIISRTQDKTSKAGRKSELAREIAKKGVELRIDMEGIVLSNQASTAGTGNGATNRKLGGFRAWLATNDNTSGSSGGFNTGTGVVDVATNGAQRAITKILLDATILSTYNAGGSPRTLMLSPYAKTVFSTFMSDANVAPQRYETPSKGQTTIVAAADMYLSDFGPVSVVPNRQMARAGAAVARNAFLIDPKMVSLGVFDDISLEKPAKTGDAEKRVLVTEYTLLVNNEAAHGVICDLYGLTSST
jgi:hypothetical protein